MIEKSGKTLKKKTNFAMILPLLFTAETTKLPSGAKTINFTVYRSKINVLSFKINTPYIAHRISDNLNGIFEQSFPAADQYFI